MNLKPLYEDLPLAFCVLRASRKRMDVLYANKAMAAILGPGAAGKAFEDAWPHKDAARLIKQLQSPAPPSAHVLPAQSPDGQARWFKLGMAQGSWEDENAWLVMATDISELQAEIAKADAMAEMKSNFLATMSHEIRTPMQTIYGILELIADERPDARIASMVGTAQGAASGLLEILDDILDIAKMDANKMELDVFEVPVRTLARGILEALAVKVHGKKIELKDNISADVPFVIIGDPKRLRQIIMNLAGNALKFTESGSVTVSVSRAVKHIAVPEKSVGLRFEITDTGIGMSEETCAKLFNSFTQADSSTSRKFGGTGLGLSICKKLTGLMGGQIGVTSIEGKGSTFWFEIPTQEVDVNATTVNLPSLDGISVLSVEDHPQGAKEIINSLRSMGAKIESCPTYAEGLALAKRRPFDVAVIDQGLPDGLGLDLIKKIMEIRPNMGLIMYTVRDDVGLQHSLQALGVTYLTKPASRAGLGDAVKNAASKASRISIEGPTRLLIAEDTESIRDILSRQLEKIGVEADFVTDGVKALEAVATGKYGLLITDLHMPAMDGYGLVKSIREREKKENAERSFPVIALTADVQMAQRDVYLSHGFDECLLKPVSLGQFKRLLIRWGLLSESAPENNPGEAPAHSGESARPAIDKNAMIEMMGAFDENAVQMLRMFVGMTEPLIARVKAAGAANDFHDLAEAAHSLKGAARSACCVELGDLAAQLQDAAEKKVPSGPLVESVLKAFDRARAEIEVLRS